jgi:hypothetical protein
MFTTGDKRIVIVSIVKQSVPIYQSKLIELINLSVYLKYTYQF